MPKATNWAPSAEIELEDAGERPLFTRHFGRDPDARLSGTEEFEQDIEQM